jgi:hypothetical protein
MKNFLIILAVSLSFLAVKCETDSPKVSVAVKETFMEVGFVKAASLVSGFDHQYDSVRLLVTNETNGLQYTYKNSKPIFNNISLSAGKYGFFIDTPDPKPIQHFMSFIGYKNDNTIIKGANTILISIESKQGLILVDKTSVTAAPTITINGTPGIMSVSTNYYYAYVVPGAVTLSYQIGGTPIQMPVTVVAQKIYVLSASTGSINVNDPFIQVITI